MHTIKAGAVEAILSGLRCAPYYHPLRRRLKAWMAVDHAMYEPMGAIMKRDDMCATEVTRTFRGWLGRNTGREAKGVRVLKRAAAVKIQRWFVRTWAATVEARRKRRMERMMKNGVSNRNHELLRWVLHPWRVVARKQARLKALLHRRWGAARRRHFILWRAHGRILKKRRELRKEYHEVQISKIGFSVRRIQHRLGRTVMEAWHDRARQLGRVRRMMRRAMNQQKHKFFHRWTAWAIDIHVERRIIKEVRRG